MDKSKDTAIEEEGEGAPVNNETRAVKTFEEKMAERMKSEEYTERRITQQKAGGKYAKNGCISR